MTTLGWLTLIGAGLLILAMAFVIAVMWQIIKSMAQTHRDAIRSLEKSVEMMRAARRSSTGVDYRVWRDNR